MLWFCKTTDIPSFRTIHTVQGILYSCINRVAVATTQLLWSVLWLPSDVVEGGIRRRQAPVYLLATHRVRLREKKSARVAYILRVLLTSLLTYSMVQSPSWEANWFARNSPHFTEREVSLPHSQTSATCLYPGPAQSSPYTHIPPPGDPSKYYPPIYA